jgi:hypothetical protein
MLTHELNCCALLGYTFKKGKAVPLHAMEALGGEEV